MCDQEIKRGFGSTHFPVTHSPLLGVPKLMNNKLGSAYQLARERYAELGVNTDAAMKRLATIPISLHCWQGDDVGGFEGGGTAPGGGLAVTGNYPGKARTADELRRDLEQALALIPPRLRQLH